MVEHGSRLENWWWKSARCQTRNHLRRQRGRSHGLVPSLVSRRQGEPTIQNLEGFPLTDHFLQDCKNVLLGHSELKAPRLTILYVHLAQTQLDLREAVCAVPLLHVFLLVGHEEAASLTDGDWVVQGSRLISHPFAVGVLIGGVHLGRATDLRGWSCEDWSRDEWVGLELRGTLRHQLDLLRLRGDLELRRSLRWHLGLNRNCVRDLTVLEAATSPCNACVTIGSSSDEEDEDDETVGTWTSLTLAERRCLLTAPSNLVAEVGAGAFFGIGCERKRRDSCKRYSKKAVKVCLNRCRRRGL